MESMLRHVRFVSTHSRTKAAAKPNNRIITESDVSTHSRTKAAANPNDLSISQ